MVAQIRGRVGVAFAAPPARRGLPAPGRCRGPPAGCRPIAPCARSARRRAPRSSGCGRARRPPHGFAPSRSRPPAGPAPDGSSRPRSSWTGSRRPAGPRRRGRARARRGSAHRRWATVSRPRPRRCSRLPAPRPCASSRCSSSTGASVSIMSAVPAGEVMAREEVLGIVSPAAATMATTSGVVRLPGSPPTQCLSTIGVRPQSMRSPTSDHGARQPDHLFEIERIGRAGRDEGRQVDVLEAAGGDVVDDLLEGVIAQPVAIDLAAHMAEGFERRRMADRDGVARLELQFGPGIFGKPDLALAQHVGGDDIERGDDGLAAMRHQHAVLRGEAFRAADMAVGAHIDMGLVQRFDAHAPGGEGGCGRPPAPCHAPPASPLRSCQFDFFAMLGRAHSPAQFFGDAVAQRVRGLGLAMDDEGRAWAVV